MRDRRRRTSATGSPRGAGRSGYLGGGLLLAVNLAVVTLHDASGIDTAMAVRLSLLSRGGVVGGVHGHPLPRHPRPAAGARSSREPGGLVRQSFGQLAATLRDMRNYPMTLTFLLAYLFYNDGIQTVIVVGLDVRRQAARLRAPSVLIATILLVQFVAFVGALLFGRLADARRQPPDDPGRPGGLDGGRRRSATSCPTKQPRAVPGARRSAIGLVLGGTQALSRSFFSQLIPRGREAEYFSLYQACERGTSWLGTLVFGLVHQCTDSYRPAIFALIVFFVVGGVLLLPGSTRAAASRRPATPAPQVV